MEFVHVISGAKPYSPQSTHFRKIWLTVTRLMEFIQLETIGKIDEYEMKIAGNPCLIIATVV